MLTFRQLTKFIKAPILRRPAKISGIFLTVESENFTQGQGQARQAHDLLKRVPQMYRESGEYINCARLKRAIYN